MEKLQHTIGEKLLEIQSRSESYSQRALAKRLGLSSGALSEILAGKRKISAKLAKRLADRLELGPAERKRLGIGESLPREPEFLLSADTFQLISDWWHFAILNLTLVEGFRSNTAWIAARLGLPFGKTKEAIERLIRLGLLKKDRNGRLTRTHKALRTSDHVRDLAVRKAHRSDLMLIERSLENVPIQLRDLSSVTFTLDPGMLPSLVAILRDFQDEFMERAESVKGKEVYRLAMHLFPLTRVESQGEQQ